MVAFRVWPGNVFPDVLYLSGELIGNSFATFSAFLRSIPDRFVLLVWECISVLCCGPAGAPRKLELRTRNKTNVEIFMVV